MNYIIVINLSPRTLSLSYHEIVYVSCLHNISALKSTLYLWEYQAHQSGCNRQRDRYLHSKTPCSYRSCIGRWLFSRYAVEQCHHSCCSKYFTATATQLSMFESKGKISVQREQNSGPDRLMYRRPKTFFSVCCDSFKSDARCAKQVF